MVHAEVREKGLPVMAERGVSYIMAQGDSLDQILIQTKKTTYGAGYTGYKLNMQSPVGDMVVGHQAEDLGLVNITGVGPGVEDPVGVEGKILSIPMPVLLFSSQGL